MAFDDVQIWPDGHGNETGPVNEPQGFRTDALATWKRLHPGVIRCLQGAGATVLDTINPGIRSRRRGGGLHQLYQLCEAVGAEPYICLPATMTREEMKGFMEYLGAPPTIGWGKLRAELGHPKPWTDSLTANNELDWNPDKPQVGLRESELANFRTGQSLPLPPHSMTTLQWETP